MDTADEHFQFAVVEDEDGNEEEDRSRLTLLKIHDDHLGVYRSAHWDTEDFFIRFLCSLPYLSMLMTEYAINSMLCHQQITKV